MIIKQLILENIRSHESTEIEFAEGKTLIRGDIGSGKSSIMMSIEAVLFGKKLKELIRKGKESGKIELTFEIKDENMNLKKYSVIRKLSTSTQKGGEIIYHSEGNKKEFSADELSIEVTRILNINETAKAQEIFQAFVLAKQNELKKLIEGSKKSDVDERTTIIMRAFEMEAYKFAIDNTVRLNQRIKNVTIGKKGEIKKLNEIEKSIQEKNYKIKKMKNDLETIKSSRIKKENTYNSKKDEYDKIKEERTKISVINSLIKSKEREINEKKEDILNNDKKRNIKKDKLVKSGKTIEQIRKGIENLVPLDGLRNKEDRLNNQITHLKMDMNRKGDDAKRYEEIQKDGKCSTCGREISNSSGYDELISTVNMEKKDIEKEIIKINKEKNAVRETIEENQKNKDLKRDVEEINDIDETNKKLDEKIQGLINEINEQKVKLNELPDENKLKLVEDEKNIAEKEFHNENNRLTIIDRDLQNEMNNLNEMNLELEKLKQTKLDINKLDDINEWLNKYFINTVQLIEDHVIHTINYKFNELFKEWFELLVEDTSKTVRVDEKFTPIIEQNEFEQTFEWLSGGEKAGIALAYRLALNSLIRQQPIGFRPELLMLDEPTDGFSKEQLTKVSNILSDIENKQVIIVSHNQEFTKLDQIISVTKENDISRIQTHSYGD